MEIAEHLCLKCKYFDNGDCECNAGHYIDMIDPYKESVIECEDFKEEEK